MNESHDNHVVFKKLCWLTINLSVRMRSSTIHQEI